MIRRDSTDVVIQLLEKDSFASGNAESSRIPRALTKVDS